MKKIKNVNLNQKDRVVCVTVPHSHEFYYQPANTKERAFLFATDDFSGAVFRYFQSKGRNINDRGYSLTIKELYEFKEYHKPKLSRVINRIPLMIEYVLREQLHDKEHECKRFSIYEKPVERQNSYDRELAA